MEPKYFEAVPADVLAQILGLTTLKDSLKFLPLLEQLKKVIGLHTYWKLLTETLLGKPLRDRMDFNWARAYIQLVAGKGMLEYVDNGALEAVSLLLEARDLTKKDGNDAVKNASRNGHLEIMKILLADKRVNPSVDNDYAIRMAAENGHLEVVKLLLADNRVDPSAGDNHAIQMASWDGHSGVVKLLLADGRADPTAADNEAIKLASSNGQIGVVKLLLADGRANPAASDNEAIKLASENGHTEVVKLLLTDKRVARLTERRRER